MLRSFTFCLLAVGLLSCQPAFKDIKETQFLLGTLVEFTIYTDDENQALEAINLAAQEMRRVEALFTTFGAVENSVKQFNRAPEQVWVRLDKEVEGLLLQALEIHKATNGAFDPTLGQLNKLWAFSGKVAPKTPPTQKEIQIALAQSGARNLQYSEQGWTKKVKGLALDFGAIAKGYAIDRGISIFKQLGVKHAIINAGGDMRILGSHGTQPWRIAIRHPRHDKPLGWIEVDKDTSIVTSGDYERFYMYQGQRYHHILNPRTGSPSTEHQSVTVVAFDATLADAWSTGLFVLEKNRGAKMIGTKQVSGALWISKDGEVSLQGDFLLHQR